MKKKIIAGIYKIKNKINGKIYIGSTTNLKGRWVEHKTCLKGKKHHSIHLQRAVNKNGIKNFKFEIIEKVFFSNETIEEKLNILLFKEQHYLNTIIFANEDNYKFNKLSYNICRIAGSCLGTKRTEEVKRKMSEIGKRNSKIHSEVLKETWKNNRQVIMKSLNNRGQEWKDNIGKSNKGKLSGVKNPMYGKKRPEVAEMSKKICSKLVLQYDLHDNFIAEFYSTREAERITNIGHSHIGRVAKGLGKTAGGFKWKYK